VMKISSYETDTSYPIDLTTPEKRSGADFS
jgi:hypothetical protein